MCIINNTMLNKYFFYHLLILILAFFLVGCAVYAVHDSSVPYLEDETQIKANKNPKLCTVDLNEIKLSIEPHNSTVDFASIGPGIPLIPIILPSYSEEEDTDDLNFTIKLLPQKGSFTFEPFKTKLTIGKDEYYPVSSKKFVGSYYRDSAECSFFCTGNGDPI